MKRALLAIVCGCGGVQQPSGPTTLAVKDETGGHLAPALRDIGAAHRTALDQASGGAMYQVTLHVTRIERGSVLRCNVAIDIETLPARDLIATLSGAATADGNDDRAARDCIAAPLHQLLDRKVVPLLRSRR